MENKKNLITQFVKKIKNNKKSQYFIIALCVVLAILFVFNGNAKTVENVKAEDEVMLYVSDLEKRLSNTLSNVNGAGKVSVVITVKSGKETVLAMKTIVKETNSGKETESSPLVVNGKTVVVKELYPQIIGVLIVAEGANNIAVMNKLQQATVSLLDINVKQIEILSMK